MKDSTVINKPPISVTAHSGIDSQKPQFSIALIMLFGRAVAENFDIPEAAIIFEIIPCTISISFSNSSSP